MKSLSTRYSITLLSFFTFIINTYANTPSDSITTITQDNKQYIQYKVDAGNTFYSLSRKYGVTVETLKKINNIETLTLNSIILIPTSSKSYHEVKPGETLYSISKTTGTPIAEIKTLNNLKDNALTIGQKLILNPSTSIFPQKNENSILHEVKPGETLYSIAKKYNISVNELKESNNLNSNSLNLGQKLRIKLKTNLNKKKPNNSKLFEITDVELINSKSNQLSTGYSEVISPYGNIGDVIQITIKESITPIYARVVATSTDNKIYASNNVFKQLNLNSVKGRVTVIFCKK